MKTFYGTKIEYVKTGLTAQTKEQVIKRLQDLKIVEPGFNIMPVDMVDPQGEVAQSYVTIRDHKLYVPSGKRNPNNLYKFLKRYKQIKTLRFAVSTRKPGELR